ncbi:hypothetical protein VE04_06604 [Pseudogymnoascus sp. 24MN13]|nr:hypothetical protein VE04_06604 [Pseudogymnoascus sp. 24MN13]
MASQTPPTAQAQATASSTERPAVSTWNPNNDPAKTGYDPTKRWANYFNILLGKMTRERQEAFREDAYIRNEARDCSNCDKWRDYLFEYSPTIRFMSKNIMDLNGKLDRSNVQCRRCPTRRVIGEDGKEHTVRQGGGFSPDHGILICANEMRNQGHLEDTLAHEMVHAWDHLRWKVDWSDLRHAACTEIRASSLSGECRWTREFFVRNNFTLTQQHQNCVRNRAIRSVMNRPSCKDDVHATKVVNEVWDSCFADTRPFDEIYR